MKTLSAEVACDHICELGEGPFWHDEALYWVDIERCQLLRFEGGQAAVIYEFPSRVGVVVPAQSGGFVCGLENGFYRLAPNLEDLEYIIDPEPERPGNRFNDGKVSPDGRFFAGTMSFNCEGQTGALYSLAADGFCQRAFGPVTVSNGLAWSADQRSFFYIDTPTRSVVQFDYDTATGGLSNRQVVVEIPENEGLPDGMCIDADDLLWVAHWDGARVSQFAPASGQKLAEVALPCPRITSCAFGGEQLDQLFITTASFGLDPKEHPEAGKLFVVEPGAKGVASLPWGG